MYGLYAFMYFKLPDMAALALMAYISCEKLLGGFQCNLSGMFYGLCFSYN
jgi:hypothetical protein